MPVTKTTFDKANDITLYTLTNSTNRLTVKIADYGATIVSIIVPDGDNVNRDVVLVSCHSIANECCASINTANMQLLSKRGLMTWMAIKAKCCVIPTSGLPLVEWPTGKNILVHGQPLLVLIYTVIHARSIYIEIIHKNSGAKLNVSLKFLFQSHKSEICQFVWNFARVNQLNFRIV